MSHFRTSLLSGLGATLLFGSMAAQAQETLKLGMSVPMSGAGGTWGRAMEYTAKQAVSEINAAGGVKVGGKSYKFEVVAYDNKYNATEGAKVAQTLLNRDEVRYVVGALGTAPVMAMQALSERKGVLVFTSAWGKSIKGPKFPLTFTVFSTPFEFLRPLYGQIKQNHPNIKTVALLNTNDASGKETEPVSREVWASLGVKVVSSSYYERGTTDFQPIATKIAEQKPDVVDLGLTPPADAGLVFRDLKVLGWNGVKALPAATGAEQLVKVGGDSAEGSYMAIAGDYEGPESTEVQRTMSKALRGIVGEPLNAVSINGYDAVMALKAGMEASNSIEPAAIAAVLPKIVFNTSYGRTAFGGAAVYGSPQQMLLPVNISQVKGGKSIDLKRVESEELARRLATAK